MVPPYGNIRFGYLLNIFPVFWTYLRRILDVPWTFLGCTLNLPSRYFLFTKGVFLLIFVHYGLLTDYCSLRFQNYDLAFVKF